MKEHGKYMVIITTIKHEKEKVVKFFIPKTQKVRWYDFSKSQLENILVVLAGIPIRKH